MTKQNCEMMQAAREDVNVFHRKYDVIHVSAQRRRHFQINSNQEVTLCAKRTCFIRGWVNIQCSDSRELEQRGLIVLRDEHHFCDDKYFLVKDFIRWL